MRLHVHLSSDWLLDTDMREYRPSEEVDFCIVGTGAGGGVLAQRLAGSRCQTAPGGSPARIAASTWSSRGPSRSLKRASSPNRARAVWSRPSRPQVQACSLGGICSSRNPSV